MTSATSDKPATNSIRRAELEAEEAHGNLERELARASLAGERAIQNAWSNTRIVLGGIALVGGALAAVALIVSVRAHQRSSIAIDTSPFVAKRPRHSVLRTVGRVLVTSLARAALRKLVDVAKRRVETVGRQ